MVENSNKEGDVDVEEEEVICEENEANMNNEKKCKSQVWKFFRKNGKKSVIWTICNAIVWCTKVAPPHVTKFKKEISSQKFYQASRQTKADQIECNFKDANLLYRMSRCNK